MRAARRLARVAPFEEQMVRPEAGMRPISRPSRLLRRAAVWAGVLLVAGYVAIGGYLYAVQRELVFLPNRARAELTRADIPGLEQIELATADGEKLIAWHVSPKPGASVLVYLHGNAGNLASPPRPARFHALTDLGFGLLAVSYRGYGGSTGSPSEEGLHQDALAAYKEAARRYGAERLVLYGESLGTGVAVRLAAEKPCAALILDAPYSSVLALAEARYPLMPVGLLMLDRFQSDRLIGQVRASLLVLHGDEDIIIPVAEGERLYAAAPEPKRLVLFHRGRHIDLYARGGIAEVRDFLADVAAGRLTGSETRRIGF